MKRAPRSRQRHDLYAKYHDYDSEISDLLGECGVKTLIARTGGVDMQSENRESGFRALLGGYALTMGNPKAIMFYIAIVPLIIDLKNITVSDFVVVSTIIVIILSSVLMGYSLGSSGVRRFFSDPVWRRRVDCVAGLILMAVAAAIWFG